MKYIIKRFSEKKEKKEDSAKEIKSAIISGGLIFGGSEANSRLSNKLDEAVKRIPSQEEANITNNLKKNAANRGIKISDEMTGRGPAYSITNNTVYTAGSKNAGAVAHEIGHAHYSSKSTKMGIGKGSHKLYKATGGSLNNTVLSPAVGIIAGIHSGKKAAKLESEGKKESKFNRHVAWAAPLAVSAVPLVAEAMASRKGLKLMKKSGASKELMNTARKDLTTAWGTYGSIAAANSGIGELSRGITYNFQKK